MKYKFLSVFTMISFINILSIKPAALEESLYIENCKKDMLVLMMAYPDEIKDIEVSYDNYIYIILKNDKKIIYDDKKEKDEVAKISQADIQDTLEVIYPLGSINEVVDGINPGRRRAYDFLDSIYGLNQNEIERNLAIFSTSCGNILFNKNAKAGDCLKKSLNKAKDIATNDSRVNDFIFPISGSYNYRVIQDTGRLSPHAYGIAIDLNRNDLDYWKWVDKSKGSKRIEVYPKELVKAFESNGFIWGGKWEKFDILHFEYRPEIILKSEFFGDSSKTSNKWYEGVPLNEQTENIINLIDSKLK